MPGEFAEALDWISIADIALQWSREPLSPVQVHERRKNGAKEDATRQLLGRMYKSRQIDKSKTGQYTSHISHNGHSGGPSLTIADLDDMTFEDLLRA